MIRFRRGRLSAALASFALFAAMAGPAAGQPAKAVAAAITVNFLPGGHVEATDTCVAWSAEAQAAFSHAASLWAAKLQAVAPIRVDACWAYREPGVLGAGMSSGIRQLDLDGAPVDRAYYPRALERALFGSEGSSGREIVAVMNAAIPNWYFGTDGNTPPDQYDFVTAVMHELGHALGFADSMGYQPAFGLGSWGLDTVPYIYDAFIENGSGQQLVTAFPNYSTALGAQLVGGGLFFEGPNTRAANADAPAALHAPSVWNTDSSIRHLAESFNATPNALMTHSLALGESIHDPGPVALGILRDIGYRLADPSPDVLYLDLAYSRPRIPTGYATQLSVIRTGSLLGAARADLGVTGGCALSSNSISFADGSTTPVPSTVTVSANAAVAGNTCTVTLTPAAPAVAVSPRTYDIQIFTADLAPDALGTASVNMVLPEATVTFAAITPTGFDWQTAISVANGSYSIGCVEGAFTTSPGYLWPGERICVRHTASAMFGATATTTLTIGGVSGTFSSITIGSPVRELANGVAATGLSGAAGGSSYFFIDVPAFATSLDIRTTAGGRGADLNMYVRRDGVPTILARDCFSAAAGTTEERCTLANPPPGRYYILLFAGTSYGGVSLVATYTAAPPPSPGALSFSTASASIVEGTGSAGFSLVRTGGTLGAVIGDLVAAGGCTLSAASVGFADGSTTPSPATVTVSAGTATAGSTCTVTLQPQLASLGSPGALTVSVTSAAPPPVGTALTSGAAVTGLSGGAGSSTHFYIDVPAGASSLVVQTSGGTSGRTGTSNVNLYARRDAVPTTGTFDCASTGTASAEICTFTSPAAGRYFVLLHGVSAYAGVNLVATFVAAPAPGPGTLALNLSGTMTSLRVTTGATSFAVTRSGGTLGAVSGSLGVTGGCTLSVASVAFADGSSVPSPATVTVSAGTAVAGATCKVTLTAAGATTGSPSTHNIAITAGR